MLFVSDVLGWDPEDFFQGCVSTVRKFSNIFTTFLAYRLQSLSGFFDQPLSREKDRAETPLLHSRLLDATLLLPFPLASFLHCLVLRYSFDLCSLLDLHRQE